MHCWAHAYGLATEASDIDQRGFYLPRADFGWFLTAVPEQVENGSEEVYCEVEKFLRLKANPHALFLESLFDGRVVSRWEWKNTAIVFWAMGAGETPGTRLRNGD